MFMSYIYAKMNYFNPGSVTVLPNPRTSVAQLYHYNRLHPQHSTKKTNSYYKIMSITMANCRW